MTYATEHLAGTEAPAFRSHKSLGINANVKELGITDLVVIKVGIDSLFEELIGHPIL